MFPATHKRCYSCEALKPIDAFRLKRKGGTSRRSDCKLCASRKSQEWVRLRMANDPEFRARRRAADAARKRAAYVSDPKANAAKKSVRRARVASVQTVPFDANQLAARISFFGGRCWMCGGAYEHLDHVKPLAKGGANMLANLRPACRSCNLSKKDRWFGVAELGRFIAAA